VSLDRRDLLGGVGGVGLAALAGCTGGSDETPTETEEPPPDALRLNGTTMSPTFPMKYVDTETGGIVAESHWHEGEPGHWHRAPLELGVDRRRTLRFEAVDLDRDPIPFGEDQPYRLVVRRTEGTPADLLESSVSGDVVSVRGLRAGEGELLTEIEHEGERVVRSLPLLVEVT